VVITDLDYNLKMINIYPIAAVIYFRGKFSGSGILSRCGTIGGRFFRKA
jgi:hypothetical protein